MNILLKKDVFQTKTGKSLKGQGDLDPQIYNNNELYFPANGKLLNLDTLPTMSILQNFY